MPQRLRRRFRRLGQKRFKRTFGDKCSRTDLAALQTLNRQKIEERVFGIHLMICTVDAPTETERRAMPRLPVGPPAMRAIHALVEIAGKGANLGDMTTSGSVKARIGKDLIFALHACAITYGLD